MKPPQQVDIRAALLLSSSFHFLCSVGQGCLLPFLTLYLRRLGLGAAATGGVMATRHLTTLLWSPLAGALTRRYDKRRLAAVLSLVGSAAMALLIPFIPPLDGRALGGRCNATAASIGSSVSISPGASFSPGVSVSISHGVRSSISPGSRISPGASIGPGVSVSISPGVSVSPTAFPAPQPLSSSSVGGVPPSALPAAGPLSNAPSEGQLAANGTLGGAGSGNKSVVNGHRPERGAPGPALSHRSLDVPEPSGGWRGVGGAGGEEDRGFLSGLKGVAARQQLLLLLLMGVVAWELLAAPLAWAVEDGLHDYLDAVDAADRHGNAPTWGRLGAALGAGGAGILVSRLPCFLVGDHVTRGATHFFLYAALAAPTLMVGSALLPLLHLDRKRARGGGLMRALRLVGGRPGGPLCAAVALLGAAGGAALEDFLLWVMEDAGAGELHMGVGVALGSLSEAAFPLLLGLCSRPPGPWGPLMAGAGALALTCLYCSFLWGPWAALPAQLLRGLGAGTLWWGVGAQAEEVGAGGAGLGVRRVYGWLCAGLGAVLGSLGAGFVAERWGVRWLLRGVALGVAACCVLLPLLRWRTPQQRRINYSRLLAADESEDSGSEEEPETDWLDRALEVDRALEANLALQDHALKGDRHRQNLSERRGHL
ncbi:major facilitator superfamily domain-containing protein 6-like [Gadus chalcogrammus]|uniref:major facilitator superfamily domain-containing protein 6-like n=1 Tax=Gadus chalcogrammus TaxID=1042646 RepID=UPI0024C2EE98|nr:major facilitator superfamily domain-containing protein 6-like [Gadus chalcogrammus]